MSWYDLFLSDTPAESARKKGELAYDEEAEEFVGSDE